MGKTEGEIMPRCLICEEEIEMHEATQYGICKKCRYKT
jgi:DNA-directed RNA polymerase subunit RPC12/RpoP